MASVNPLTITPTRILLVEDDELLGTGLRAGLTQFGYTVDWVKDGKSAVQALQNENFGTIILDLGLPKMSGIDVLKVIRAKKNTVPVLILTANDSLESRVAGLDAGADDYIPKPFDLRELCARIRALQRRTASRAVPIIIVGGIKLDPAARKIYYNNEEVECSRREFVLMQMLLENAGKVLTRDQITQNLYGWGDDIDSNALEVHIHNLRKKFGTDTIRTIRGVGYIIEKPVDEEIE
jgi:two-component system response regulator QseB